MIQNIELREKYYHPYDLSQNRKSGISAICRCKNEEEFCIPSLLSVKDFFNELIIVLNKCTDKSEELIKKLNLPNVKIFQYPFDVIPAGPDTKDVSIHSLSHIVYYTNYCISLSSHEWIYRFDLDHIARPNFYNLKDIISCDRYNSVEDRGFDLVGPNCDQLGSQEMCSFERRLIRIKDNVRYILSPNKYAEQAYVPGLSYRVEEPTFIHCRWCLSNPIKYWKSDWENDPHFKAIKDRHDPVKSYEGPLPSVLQKYLELRKDPIKLIDLYHQGKI